MNYIYNHQLVEKGRPQPTTRLLIIIFMPLLCSTTFNKSHAEVNENFLRGSLCSENEKTYFSCDLPKKNIASLCGIKKSSQKNESTTLWGIRYRYGTKTKMRINFPSQVDVTETKFFGEHLKPSGENIVIDSIMFSVKGNLHGISVRDGTDPFIGIWTVGPPYKETECVGNPPTSSFLDLVLSLPAMK